MHENGSVYKDSTMSEVKIVKWNYSYNSPSVQIIMINDTLKGTINGNSLKLTKKDVGLVVYTKQKNLFVFPNWYL